MNALPLPIPSPSGLSSVTGHEWRRPAKERFEAQVAFYVCEAGFLALEQDMNDCLADCLFVGVKNPLPECESQNGKYKNTNSAIVRSP